MDIKKFMMFLILFSAIGIFTGCSGDDDSGEPVEAGVYNLTLQNNTDNEVIVFLKDAELTAGFEERGTIAAGGEIVLEELVVRQSYVVRASLTQDPSEFFYEETVFQATPTDVTLQINE